MFQGRKIAIATMHQKEVVIAPLLVAELGLKTMVPKMNTDQLGTFSGEIKRECTSLEAARQKCFMAIQQTGFDMAIASEGSFGAHPQAFFASANEEFILLVDQKNGWEFSGRALTTETNYAGRLVETLDEAQKFCEQVGFPDHAVVVKEKEGDFDMLYKGITSYDRLNSIIDELLLKQHSFWIETDMRAMMNPTRMKNIKRATQNLIEKIQSKCPECEHLGFWKVEALKGLLCKNCQQPTKSVKSYRYECENCKYETVKAKYQEKEFEHPMYCDYCNP